MSRLIGLLLVALLCGVIFSTGACSSSDRVVRLSDGKVIRFEDMIREVARNKIIIVGENHDEPAHHAAQLAVIKALRRKGLPIAVGMEMFPAESQAHLDHWVAGQTEQRDFIQFYYRNWQMPWPLYRNLLLYVRNKGIPLLGINVPQQLTKRVADEGFAALSAEEKRRLPPDITCNVDPAYMAFIRGAYRAHDRSTKTFIHFCEAQKLWNRSMAWYLVRYLEKNPERRIVVVAGAGHALKRAVPAEIADLSSVTAAVILPQMDDLPPSAITRTDADYLLLSR